MTSKATKMAVRGNMHIDARVIEGADFKSGFKFDLRRPWRSFRGRPCQKLFKNSLIEGAKTSPEKSMMGLRCAYDLTAVQKRAAPPTGSWNSK